MKEERGSEKGKQDVRKITGEGKGWEVGKSMEREWRERKRK